MSIGTLLVYGTLRPGNAEAVSISGWRMYDLGWYPGVVKSDDPDDVVIGEIVPVKSDEHLADIDRYEGCQDNSPDSLYHRVNLSNKEDEPLWLYVYNGPLNNCPRVYSGDWLDHKSHDEGSNSQLITQKV